MKIDWPNEWYRAWHDCGEDVSIVFGHLIEDSNDAEPDWTTLPHYDFDGIGGLVYLLRKQGCLIDKLPVLRNDRLTFFRAVRGLLTFIPTGGIWQQRWRQYDRTCKNRSLSMKERVAWHLFSEEQTKEIISKAKNSGVSLNTFLLFHCDAAVASQLAIPSSPRRWCVPINLRGAVKRPSELTSHVSYLGVDFKHHITISQLQQQIDQLRAHGYHWGSWLGITGGFLLGIDGMRKYYRTNEEKGLCWTGTFSNLGSWEVRDSGNWLFGPHITNTYPVGAGCLTMNNRLAITIQLHEAFGNDIHTRRSILENWKEACLKGIQEKIYSPGPFPTVV